MTQGVVPSFPSWRRYVYLVIALLVVSYLAWSLWGKRDQQPGQGFVPAKSAVTSPKIPGPVIKVPIRIVPKVAVKDAFPESHVDDPDEEVIDTAKVPPAPDGAVTITTLNSQTGEARTEVKINPAPWFALERANEIGVGVGIGTGGKAASIHYRRDILRVKDLHLTGNIEGILPTGEPAKAEGRAELQINWRF